MKAALAVLLVLSACAAGGAYAQTNLGDLRDAPSAKFTPQDFEMLWAAIDEVGGTKKVGTTKEWANAESGNGGTIKLLKSFVSTDGRDCRRLRVDNYAKSLKGSTKQIVCATPDGKWMLDAGARPPPAH